MLELVSKAFAGWKKRNIVIVGVVFLLVIYFVYQKFTENPLGTIYVSGEVEKGTIISSVSGTGQVSTLHQVDLSSKVSGQVIQILVDNGQEVEAGQILAVIDSGDAYKSVRDAELSLELSQISLDKLKNPADDISIAQAENSLKSAQDSLTKLKLSQKIDYDQALTDKTKAGDSIVKAYEDAFSTVSDVYVDTPGIVTGLYDILYGYDISASEANLTKGFNYVILYNALYDKDRDDFKPFETSVRDLYDDASDLHDSSFTVYKGLDRDSEREVVDKLLDDTLVVTKYLSQTVKAATNYLDAWVDFQSERKRKIFSTVTDYQSDLVDYASEVNGHISAVLSAQRDIEDSLQALNDIEVKLSQMEQNNPLDIRAAEATIKEKENNLVDLKDGADPLDVRSQEISVQQRYNTLQDAREKLLDYSITAPFAGIVANFNLSAGDDLSSGTTVSTLLTTQQIAEISLNEVDVAKVKVGNKVTLTFDAIEDLSITGEVVDVALLGEVNQGVVSYDVKILFDTSDERVKPGMTVNSAIITEVKQDVLYVPNAAIKTDADGSYVQLFVDDLPEGAVPEARAVEVGSSNDSLTEIISGLEEGEKVIVRTVSNSSDQSASQSSSLFGGGSSRGAIPRGLR